MIYAFYDERIPKQNAESLRSLGFFPIALSACSSLSAPVCSHADLQMVCVGDSLLIHPQLAHRMPSLAKAKGVIVDEVREDEPMHEARLCGLVGGGCLFGNKRILSPRLLSLCEEKGLRPVHTNQGYAACSTLFLDDRHAVTADEGIYRTMRAEGVEVLKISKGGVALSPYPYGFLGGASGVFDGCVYFIGSLASHPDAEQILCFIESCGMRACSLSVGALFDGGGIVFWESEAQIFVEQDAQNDSKQRN